MGLVSKDDGWRVPDELWDQMQPLLPPRPAHPLGCHNPRVADRSAMDAILLVLRTGMQWNALNATAVCSSSSAYRRFRELRCPQARVRELAQAMHEIAIRRVGLNKVTPRRKAASAPADTLRVAAPTDSC